MKIAVDLNKTITDDVKFFKKLCILLLSNGIEVIVLTGNKTSDNKKIENRVKSLGIRCTEVINHDDRTHTHNDKFKGKYCRDNRIDAIIEDNDGYIEDVKRWSPNTKIIKYNKTNGVSQN